MKITRKELKEIIHEVADELGLFEGLTKAQEKLPEPLKAAILKKQESDDASDTEEEISEGNAWGSAVRKAREENLKEFEFNGKVYTLTEDSNLDESEDTEEFTGEDDEEVEEGNAFGDAVRKAKEAGEDEFEVDGKTFQVKEESGCYSEEDETEEEVEEGNAFGDAVRKAKEAGEDEFEVDGKTFQVKEGVVKNFQGCTLSETLARISGNKKIIT
tara:strand:+ start:37833 stop:38477 length:645 start_codon:yes stop_codon:yes gene_type:complete